MCLIFLSTWIDSNQSNYSSSLYEHYCLWVFGIDSFFRKLINPFFLVYKLYFNNNNLFLKEKKIFGIILIKTSNRTELARDYKISSIFVRRKEESLFFFLFKKKHIFLYIYPKLKKSLNEVFFLKNAHMKNIQTES